MDGIVRAARARQPQQERSRQRVSAILEQAEALILEVGTDAFSIAALAERLGFPRATIYMFFPTPLAMFNELAARHFAAMQRTLADEAPHIAAASDWRDAVKRSVHITARYLQTHPVANRLVLGPLSDSSFRSWEATINKLGEILTAMLKSRGVTLLESELRTGPLAVEFGAVSFRMSYLEHGTVTSAYADAAAEVITSFLAPRIVVERKKVFARTTA